MTYYDGDQILIEFFSGGTPVKVTQWNSDCHKAAYLRDARTGIWQKYKDRLMIWERDAINNEYDSHIVCICHSWRLRIANTAYLFMRIASSIEKLFHI